jgi:hypothetical protein
LKTAAAGRTTLAEVQRMLRPAIVLTVSIAAAAPRVYAFVADPLQMSSWAHGLGGTPTRLADGAWRMETASGAIRVAFAPPNAFGVVDHVVTSLAGDGPAVDVPLRVISNEAGSEVQLTLFRQPEMSDEQFTADAATVRADLQRLKLVLEAQAND